MPRSIKEKQANGMAWAVDATTRAPVYIGKLTRAQTGLRCGCICPACDAPLQAVNAGVDANQSVGPHFRHHVGVQGPGCKHRVAELAALRLLAEKGVIEIPAPRRTAVRVGASGMPYTGEAVGSAIRERIVERRLLSQVGAVLTLESGRKVALVLRGHQDVGELGSVFAIVQVQVTDPEVAWMSPEEILQRSQLSTEWLHVVKHDDDRAIQAAADEDAWGKALDQLDVDPQALGLPVGATPKQASESLVHWAVKDALMNLGWLQAPELRLNISAVGNEGHVHTSPVHLPPVRLDITDVVDEVLFDGYRADIVCQARDADDQARGAWRLLVEVAVTNKVKPEKLRLIQRADVACIELDVMGFAREGRVTRQQLRDLVATDVSSKSWLHHPSAAGLAAKAQAKANAARDADDVARAAIAAREDRYLRQEELRAKQEQERAERKLAWAASLGRQDALRELRGLLRQRWSGGQEYTSNRMQWGTGEFERAIEHVLPRHAVDARLLVRGGIAWRLESVIRCGKSWSPPLDVTTVLDVGAVYVPIAVEQWLGLLHMAIERCQASIETTDRPAYEAQREKVFASLHAGKSTYARPATSDKVLAGLFPELSELLAEEFGTTGYANRIRREREEARTKAEAAAREAEEFALEERKRKLAEEAAEQERRRLPDAIESVVYQWAWKPNLNVPPSAAVAVDFLKGTRHKNCNEHMRDLVRAGFDARLSGTSFATWFASKDFTSEEQVLEACAVLEAAWLVQSNLAR